MRYWMDAEKILDWTVVVTDDLNLPLGPSLRAKGSDGGHNGLKDIQAVPNQSTPGFGLALGLNSGKASRWTMSWVLGRRRGEHGGALDHRDGRAAQHHHRRLGRAMNITTESEFWAASSCS